MPRAGFYAVESGRISFRRDGNWYTNEERIDNPRIALLFSRSIRRGAGGGYYLEVGDERAPIEVEDTPYVVRTIEDDGGALMIVLNDGTREPLDPASLAVGAQDVPYCSVKGGEFEARFLRPAYYHLSRYFDSGPGGYCINLAGKSYPLGKRPPVIKP
jgi:hypothetical protein